jgi:4a-hydroxytetrahydrobiopterin dehydratase
MSIKALDPDEIILALKNLPLWKQAEDGTKLLCEIKFPNFRAAIAFIVRLGFECENQNHHAEIFNAYNIVKLGLNTHDAGNRITEKDLQLARKVGELVASS